MKIYTKTGDKGTTQVYTSEVLRLNKNDAILECYGSIDELNSHIGMLSALLVNDKFDKEEPCLSQSFMFGIQKALVSLFLTSHKLMTMRRSFSRRRLINYSKNCRRRPSLFYLAAVS